MLGKTLACQRTKPDGNYSTASTTAKNKDEGILTRATVLSAALNVLLAFCLTLTWTPQGRFRSACFIQKETQVQCKNAHLHSVDQRHIVT